MNATKLAFGLAERERGGQAMKGDTLQNLMHFHYLLFLRLKNMRRRERGQSILRKINRIIVNLLIVFRNS